MEDYSSDTSYGPDMTVAAPEPSYTPDIPVADPPYMTQTPAEYLGIEEPSDGQYVAPQDAPELAEKWSEPLTETGQNEGFGPDDYSDRETEASDEAADAYGAEESASAAEAVAEAARAANEEAAGQVTSSYEADEDASSEFTIDTVYTVVSADITNGGLLVRSDGRAHMHVEKAAVVYTLNLTGDSPDWRISAASLAGVTCLDEKTASLEEILIQSLKGGITQQRYANTEAGTASEPSDVDWAEAPEFLRVFAEGNRPNSVPPGLL